MWKAVIVFIAVICDEITYSLGDDLGRGSCSQIKARNPRAVNGLYDIADRKGSVYRTYCDMTIAGGGWQLVASVHENFLGGKCTTGDRWSSQQGNTFLHRNGDEAWSNTAIFGAPESAASDDYKNPGYFNMIAGDVMIWHVPNHTPMDEYASRSFMQYHTDSGFLYEYNGNLYSLFNNHYPLLDGEFDTFTDNGPSPRVVWDKGSDEIMVKNTPPLARVETTPGYIQFRAINNEREPYPVCPGVKMNPGYGRAEHVCIGGTGAHRRGASICGDFAGKDFGGYGTGQGWSSNEKMTESVVMLFYR